MKKIISKQIIIKQNENNNFFTIYHRKRIIMIDAEKFNVFKDEVLVAIKCNYLFVYEISNNDITRRYTIKINKEFLNTIVYIDKKRYLVDFECKIACLGKV